MRAAGCDVSSRKVALACLDEHGGVAPYVAPIDGQLRGARRLVQVRAATITLADALRDVGVFVVEIPWASGASSFVLLSIAGVVMEALQVAVPAAVVLERSTGSWKCASVGKGNASKAECLAHANTLGYQGADQDVADSVCMAQAAWEAWHHQETRSAQ